MVGMVVVRSDWNNSCLIQLAGDDESEATSRSVFSEKLNLMTKIRPFESRLGDTEKKDMKEENKENSKLLKRVSELCQMPLVYCDNKALFELYDRYKEVKSNFDF